MQIIPKRSYIEYTAHFALANPRIVLNPGETIGEVYKSVGVTFKVDPRSIQIIRSDKVGEIRIAISLLDGFGRLEITASGYSVRFENILSRADVPKVWTYINILDAQVRGSLQQDIAISLYSFVDAIWFSIDGNNQEDARLFLDRFLRLDGSVDPFGIGSTESGNPQYRREFWNKVEKWRASVDFQESAIRDADLFYSLSMSYDHGGSHDNFARMSGHHQGVYSRVLQSAGLSLVE